MLYFFSGTDTEKAREKMNVAALKTARGADVVRITDAHTLHDLNAALQGGGMFPSAGGQAGGARVVVLDRVLGNEEMRAVVLARLPHISKSADTFYIYESSLDATIRKIIEKHAEKSEKFDATKQPARETIFALANALQSGKKKDLWVGYQRELAAGKSPEAIHGVLFWAAKQALLKNARDERAHKLVASLAELPHESRRQGQELEYALERFILASA